MKKNRLALFALIGVSLVAVSTVGMTVAWYNRGVYAFISQVKVSFRGEPNLLISTSSEPSTFKERLSYDELKKVTDFSPVSSMYSNKWLDKGDVIPKFTASFDHVEEGEEPFYALGGYYQQDIYLSSKEDIYVTIDSDLFSFAPDHDANVKAYDSVKDRFPGLSKDEVIAQLDNVVNSLRCSIFYQDDSTSKYVIYDPFKDKTTYLAGILDTDLNAYFDYSDITNKEKIYGDYSNEDKFVFDENTSDIPYTGLLTCFNSGHKANVSIFNLTESISKGAKLGEEQSYSPSQIANQLLIPLRDEIPTKITLSIYLEGWDTDNTDLAKSGSFLADIAFKIKGDILP